MIAIADMRRILRTTEHPSHYSSRRHVELSFADLAAAARACSAVVATAEQARVNGFRAESRRGAARLSGLSLERARELAEELEALVVSATARRPVAKLHRHDGPPVLSYEDYRPALSLLDASLDDAASRVARLSDGCTEMSVRAAVAEDRRELEELSDTSGLLVDCSILLVHLLGDQGQTIEAAWADRGGLTDPAETARRYLEGPVAERLRRVDDLLSEALDKGGRVGLAR